MGHTYRWQIWRRVLTLFGGYSYEGVSAGIWVIHTGGKSGGELVTLFGVHCDDAVSAVIWVLQQVQVLVFGSYIHV